MIELTNEVARCERQPRFEVAALSADLALPDHELKTKACTVWNRSEFSRRESNHQGTNHRSMKRNWTEHGRICHLSRCDVKLSSTEMIPKPADRVATCVRECSVRIADLSAQRQRGWLFRPLPKWPCLVLDSASNIKILTNN